MTRHEKELQGFAKADCLFNDFLGKFISFDGFKVTYGKTGNFPVKSNLRLFCSSQKYKNRPVYKFEIGYPNITNNACLDRLLFYFNVYYGL